MPVLTETVHHASGTYVQGADLPADHPLVVSAPHLFEPFEVEAAPPKRGPGRPRKES